jgi:hypothetical protein
MIPRLQAACGCIKPASHSDMSFAMASPRS